MPVIQRKCHCGGRCLGGHADLENAEVAPLVQAKLKVGPMNDKYEQEADRIADQVMRMPEPIQSVGSTAGGALAIQRTYAEGEENEDEVQAKLEAGSHVPTHGSDALTTFQGSGAIGQPLGADLQSFYESRFGHDFGRVRVHTGSSADKAAKSIHARAFTMGSDVVFGAGEFSPQSMEGRRLLAHELCHVVQQGHGGMSVQRSISLDWKGETKNNVNPASRVLNDSNRFVGVTIPVLNGKTVRSAAEARAAVRAPKFESRSAPPLGWECSVKSVGDNEVSTIVRLPEKAPWVAKMPQTQLWKLRVPGCDAFGTMTKVTAHGRPTEDEFTTKVRDHEDEHVLDELNSFTEIFSGWDKSLTQLQKDGASINGRTPEGCQETLYAIAGGSAADMAERWFERSEAKGHDFHKTEAGKPVQVVDGVSRDSCNEAEIWLEMP